MQRVGDARHGASAPGVLIASVQPSPRATAGRPRYG